MLLRCSPTLALDMRTVVLTSVVCAVILGLYRDVVGGVQDAEEKRR